MKEIIQGVFQLESTRGSYAYVWSRNAQTTLVDTSLPGKGPGMISELDEAGLRPQNIVITHYDIDHIRNMALLAQHYGAHVWIPKDDAPYVLGDKSRPGIKRIIGAVVKIAMPPTWSPVESGQEVGGLNTIASPGHTPGHMAYAGDHVLFVGDAFRTRAGQVIPSPRILAWNTRLETTSRRLLLSEFSGWICPAHGEVIAWPPL